MMRVLRCGFYAYAVLICGCAAPPAPIDTSQTTVVLLPDEEGNVGAITVTNQLGTLRVDQAFTTTKLDAQHPGPTAGAMVGKDAIDSQYASLLRAQPPKPVSFILYFGLGSTELTAESKALLPEVLRAARERKPTEITVFGFADATGTEKRNEQLSSARATSIENALRKFDANLGHIDVQFFGAKNPVVASPANVPEQRNRRAEIFIL